MLLLLLLLWLASVVLCCSCYCSCNCCCHCFFFVTVGTVTAVAQQTQQSIGSSNQPMRTLTIANLQNTVLLLQNCPLFVVVIVIMVIITTTLIKGQFVLQQHSIYEEKLAVNNHSRRTTCIYAVLTIVGTTVSHLSTMITKITMTITMTTTIIRTIYIDMDNKQQ